CIHFCSLRSDVKSHPSVRDLILCNYLRICIVGESICCNSVNRKKKFNTFLLCFLDHVKCILQIIFLKKGISYISTLGFCECKAHSAADDECINFLKKVVD